MKKYYLYILLASTTLVTSCKDFLDLVPEHSIVDSNFWKTEAQLRAAADAIYGRLDNKTTVDMEQMADNTQWHVLSAWGRIGAGIIPNNYSTVEGTWTNNYGNIGECNRFLANYNQATETVAGNKEKMAAEVKVLRAFFYYQLAFLFGDVPLVTTPLESDDPKIFGPRDPKAQVIDFILKDLDDAIAVLPAEIPSGTATGRIAKGAALAIKARIALYNEKWDIAATASKQLMDLNLYSLYTAGGPQNAYRDLFTHAGKLARNNNKETIFARMNLYGISMHNFSREMQVQEHCRWNATASLAEAYLCSDGLPIDKSPLYKQTNYNTIWENRDPRMEQTLLRPGAKWGGGWDGNPANTDPTIYTAPKFTQNQPNNRIGSRTITGYYFTKYVEIPEVARVGQDENDFHLIRLAEVYLTYAEAKLEQGNLTQNDLDISINLLRKRVGMTPMNIANMTANGLNIRTEIRRERRVELALEGQRYFDILRWKEGHLLGQDMRGIKKDWAPVAAHVASFPTDSQGYILVRPGERTFNPNKHYLWPIPNQQRLYNPALDQNPGWEE
ncbi:RagB/SusD family nutrient uptake outer membrane protein [Sphingobacterium spiritivorum]|uniref:RagB/SusD family nutrient uptake outer membrane protein n=1 Tax=Sphingobacterium spiritivorum TaxID=258 RepID=UPI003DA6887C